MTAQILPTSAAIPFILFLFANTARFRYTGDSIADGKGEIFGMDALLYTLLTQADRQKKAGAGWLSALVLVLLLAGCTAARPSFLALRFHLALVTCKRCVTFFLQANQLQGPLPPTLGDLHRLQDLHLCENQLQGPLPLTLAQLADLQHVKLQRNDASLCLPASMLTWAHSRAIYEAPPGGLCP